MHELLADAPIERIAVFRALMLGDMLCTVPALRALRSAFPRASIAWVGLEPTRPMAERLGHLIDQFVAFPGHPQLPEIKPDVAAYRRFMSAMRSRRFDLALQLHGSGSIVNPIVAGFRARHAAGFFDASAPVPRADRELFRRWPLAGHEALRLLALTDHLGLERRGTALEFPLHDADRRALAERWPAWRSSGRYVCLHAGAQLASRRWPVERFAAVGKALSAAQRTVVLTGAPGDAPIAAELLRQLDGRAVDLVGATDLGMLGALVERAEAVVCNDTSISHIAAALGTRSVIVSCGADVARWAPLDRARHRVLWHDMACRPCGYRECPIGHGCALAIEPPHVLATLAALGIGGAGGPGGAGGAIASAAPTSLETAP